ncbi:VirB8/TrbF family protein [Rhizobium sp. LCM 4573]|uniref:VirB8/TrbF family protein n=1 Tax=Rhizobium sp. LCM 4573 TaxID=1848291 RepID=UPI0008DA7A6E|nr:VirB8/TrbF family protein [Rhizobium sp. LCM 4573]OHV78555.1 conjugal transfer protein [Rhizobium sp. LCM 4573]
MERKKAAQAVAAPPAPPVEESPYLAARREWNERYGDHVKASNDWKIATFMSLAVAFVAAGGMVYYANQPRTIPYAVERNEHGEVVNVARLERAAPVGTREIKAALRSWVIGARTVYVDNRATQDRVNATYNHTLPDSPAYKELAMYHRDNNPYQRAVNETVEVQVHAVQPISDESWQVEWSETVKQRSGAVVGTKQMQGTFTVLVAPSEDDATMMVNPFGIYVRQFSWTTRL